MPIAAPDRQSPSRGTRAPRNHLLHHCHRSRSRRHCSRVDGPCVGLRGPRSGQRRQAICPSWPPDRPGPPRGTEGPPVALAFDPHAGHAWRPWISPAARCARCPVARSGLSVGTVCGTRLSEFGLEPLYRFTMKGDPVPPQLMGVSIPGSLRQRALRPWDLTGRLMFAARWPAPAGSVCGTRLSLSAGAPSISAGART